MSAREYLRTHQKSMCYFEDVKRIVNELSEIRHDKKATEDYYERILTSDIRYNQYEEWDSLRREYGGSGLVEPECEQYFDEIDKDYVSFVREELLKAVQDDNSFGYIVCLLSKEQKIEISQNKIETAIREDLVTELILANKRILELEQKIIQLREDIDNQKTNVIEKGQRNSDENESKGTMKVQTVVLLEILKKVNINKGNTDLTKIVPIISYLTGKSEQKMYNEIIKHIMLNKYHLIEIDKVNNLLSEINIGISIEIDKGY